MDAPSSATRVRMCISVVRLCALSWARMGLCSFFPLCVFEFYSVCFTAFSFFPLSYRFDEFHLSVSSVLSFWFFTQSGSPNLLWMSHSYLLHTCLGTIHGATQYLVVALPRPTITPLTSISRPTHATNSITSLLAPSHAPTLPYIHLKTHKPPPPSSKTHPYYSSSTPRCRMAKASRLQRLMFEFILSWPSKSLGPFTILHQSSYRIDFTSSRPRRPCFSITSLIRLRSETATVENFPFDLPFVTTLNISNTRDVSIND
jgi:hypothetical protein